MTSDTASCKVGSSTKNILQCSVQTVYLRCLLPLLTVLPSILTLPCDLSPDVSRTEQGRSYCASERHYAEAGGSSGNWCSRKHGLIGWVGNVTLIQPQTSLFSIQRE